MVEDTSGLNPGNSSSHKAMLNSRPGKGTEPYIVPRLFPCIS